MRELDYSPHVSQSYTLLTTWIVTHICNLTGFHQPLPTLAGWHRLAPTSTARHQLPPVDTGQHHLGTGLNLGKVYKESHLRFSDSFPKYQIISFI